MKRMWRVSWHDGGQATHFADYPKRRQARAHEAAVRALRGTRVGGELVYWVLVEVAG